MRKLGSGTRLQGAIASLPPASFAFVMATRIVSTALALVHNACCRWSCS